MYPAIHVLFFLFLSVLVSHDDDVFHHKFVGCWLCQALTDGIWHSPELHCKGTCTKMLRKLNKVSLSAVCHFIPAVCYPWQKKKRHIVIMFSCFVVFNMQEFFHLFHIYFPPPYFLIFFFPLWLTFQLVYPQHRLLCNFFYFIIFFFFVGLFRRRWRITSTLKLASFTCCNLSCLSLYASVIVECLVWGIWFFYPCFFFLFIKVITTGKQK